MKSKQNNAIIPPTSGGRTSPALVYCQIKKILSVIKKILIICICVLIVPVYIYGTSFSSKDNTAVSNRTNSFDENWRFIKNNPSGAENPGFDDSGLRTLDLPHDWSIEDLPNQDGINIIGPFSKASIGKM